MEEWGAKATIEHETVRAVIQAYADGKIELPAPGKSTPDSAFMEAPSVIPVKEKVGPGGVPRRAGEYHHFTRLSVAKFLGWTKKKGNKLTPNYACTQSFQALELIERKLLKESDFNGLSREQSAVLVKETNTSQRFCRPVFRGVSKHQLTASIATRRNLCDRFWVIARNCVASGWLLRQNDGWPDLPTRCRMITHVVCSVSAVLQ